MKALVTGGKGFVGRHLVVHLRKSGDEVVSTARAEDFLASSKSDSKKKKASESRENGQTIDRSKLSSAEIEEAIAAAAESDDTGVPFEVLDVTSYTDCCSVFEKHKPEVIYHLAGSSFVPACEKNFAGALLANVSGTGNVVRAAHELLPGARVVFISSSEVYGKIDASDLPITEELTPRPNNNYSLTKLMAEEVCHRYARYGKVHPIIMRPFNHIGPGQASSFVASSFALQLAQIAAGAEEPVMRVGNLEARRDFTDVRDIVAGYRAAAAGAESGVYNLCSGKAVSISTLLEKLIDISGVEVEKQQDPKRMRPSEMPEMFGSYAKAQSEFGWEPKFELDKTLRVIYKDAQLLAKK